MATTITTRHGTSKATEIQVQPSYPNKPKAVENLMKGLDTLLRVSTSGTEDDIQDIPKRYWNIDSTGDTVHRHVEVEPEQAISNILQQVEIASRELNHDPHTYVEGTRLTISCTTHVPPGLSMKDVKLAKKIDEIIEAASYGEDEVSVKEIDESDEWRGFAEKHNMNAIVRAKEQCSCG